MNRKDSKVGRRYRYYVTRPDMLDGTPPWRVSAYDLEKLVCARLSLQLTDQQFLYDLAGDVGPDIVQQVIAKADLTAATLRSGTGHEQATLLVQLISRIDVQEECIELEFDQAKLATLLGLESAPAADPITLLVAAAKVRRGHQLRLVIPGPPSLTIAPTGRDEKLVALLADAHAARQLLLAAPDQSIAAIAAANGRCRTRLAKLAALACLAPDIATAIVEGRQPVTLNARSLQGLELPPRWADQRALLGLA